MKLKIKLSLSFIILYSLFMYFNITNNNQRIEQALEVKKKNLETHYNLTMSYFIQDAKSIKNDITNNQKVINIFSEAKNATKEQRVILRERLYKLLAPLYKRIHKRGILQFQFVFPNNISFLRMHKPSKFGDDLTDIRYSFKQVNITKQIVIGFEQGRTTHGFRYVFPFYDKKGNHLGAVEISLDSSFLQERLLYVNKIHSHFLVNKKIFDVKAWETEDLIQKYIPSIEYKDYMFALTENFKSSKLEFTKKNFINPLKEKIADKISLKKTFALYLYKNGSINVVTFLPIKNTQEKEVVAYLVSYTKSNNIYNILSSAIKLSIIILITMILLFYFIYKNLNYEIELEEEVERQLKHIKNATKEQEVLLSLFDMGDSVLFNWNNDDSWSVKIVSSGIYKLLGYTSKEFIDGYITYKECIYKEDIERVSQEVLDAQKNKDKYFKHIPYRLVTKSNQIKWVHDYTLIIKDDNNIITNYIGNITDITEDREKDKQLIHQNRLAQMGEMISMIAHQWRQPLNNLAILNQTIAFKYKRDLLNSELMEEFKINSNKQIQDMSKTIDDFRNFFKLEKEKVDFCINDVINHVIDMISPIFGKYSISINFDSDKKFNLNGFPNELGQAIVNIINNSKDALIEEDIQYKKVSITLQQKRNKIIIIIEDNGGGIPKEIMPKILDPYFSTKIEKNGTGIGLYMTKMIIEDHMDGKIIVQNSNEGAIFKLILKAD